MRRVFKEVVDDAALTETERTAAQKEKETRMLRRWLAEHLGTPQVQAA